MLTFEDPVLLGTRFDLYLGFATKEDMKNMVSALYGRTLLHSSAGVDVIIFVC